MFNHVFLDAEGTLYLPKNGKTRHEFWAAPSPARALEFFELEQGVKESLEELRALVDTICLVSRNLPEIIDALLERFGIRHYFDEILLNGDKGTMIADFLDTNDYRLDEAVMVGDMPALDFYPVRRAGIEAVLVDRDYNRWADAPRIAGVRELPARLRIGDIARGDAQETSATLPRMASLSSPKA